MTASVDLFGVQMPLEAAVALVGEVVVGIVLLASVYMAAKHQGRVHHWMMLSAYLGDELVLKPIMYYRASLGVFGPFPFYHTSGFTHLIIGIVAAALGLAAILLAFKFRARSGKKMYLKVKGRPHRWFGAAYVVAWYVSLFYGLLIVHQVYGAF